MYILYLYCPVEIILILGILNIIRVSYSCGFNKSSLCHWSLTQQNLTTKLICIMLNKTITLLHAST